MEPYHPYVEETEAPVVTQQPPNPASIPPSNQVNNKNMTWIFQADMFLPTLQNVTFWRATRCGLQKIAQKIQEKAKKHQYLTKKFMSGNAVIW